MQFANFDLNDSSAVATTFTAKMKDGLIATWYDKSVAVPSLRPTISCGMRPAKGSSPRKVTVKVILPYTHTVDSVTYTGETSAFLDVIVPEHADATNVQDLLAFVSGAVLQAQISGVVEDGEFPA
jgi:hypothetical protein